MDNDRLARAVADALVDAGLLDPDRREEATPVIGPVLAPTVARAVASVAAPAPTEAGVAAAPLRRRMAEVAGYVGGALVVGAAVLFFGNSWPDLALAARVGVLAGIAALLLVVGGGVVALAGGPAALRAAEEAIRRRLASVLLTGAAAAAAFAVGVWLDEVMAEEQAVVTLSMLVALLAVLAGYRVAASTVGQLGAAAAAFMLVPAALAWVTEDFSEVLFGGIILGLGTLWVIAAETGAWREAQPARIIGLSLALVGAQIPAFGDEVAWAYTLTGAVAVLAFAGYLTRRAWPYLAAGVVGLTVAVPEALFDLTGESLGAAGVLLATGLTLLVAALLGLRLRQEVEERTDIGT